MPERLPLFPLNTVLFPGLLLPLHVFEDQYRAMVRDVVAAAEGGPPHFGVVAIKIGYEVGDHGGRTIHSFGCVAEINDLTANDEGTFDIVVRGTSRFRLNAVDRAGGYLVGTPKFVPETAGNGMQVAARRARRVFDDYREVVEAVRGIALLEGELPSNDMVLSYVLAATVVLELAQRQQLLETVTVTERLDALTALMLAEIQTISAVASLPATDIARTGWSPN